MNNTKFTMNALLIVVMIFAAIGLFFTIKLVNMADRLPVNDFYNIEGTDLSIRYSSLEPSGIYRGNENSHTLVMEGNYGYDWGAIADGDSLYINEYTGTDLGLILCNLVKIDLNTFEKETLYKDTILRGRCKSGELVLMKGYIMPSNAPRNNSLIKFYSMASPDIRTDDNSAVVVYLDPSTGEEVYSLKDKSAKTDTFDSRFIERTLEEVKE